MSSDTPKTESYLILLCQPAGGVPPPHELNKVMVQFGDWLEGMRGKGMLQGTTQLELTGKTLHGHRGASITDGPYAEAKEVIGGFALISAVSLQEAVEAARGCPGLNYRMTVEVRPIRPRPADND